MKNEKITFNCKKSHTNVALIRIKIHRAESLMATDYVNVKQEKQCFDLASDTCSTKCYILFLWDIYEGNTEIKHVYTMIKKNN